MKTKKPKPFSRTDYCLLKRGCDWRNPRKGWAQDGARSKTAYGPFATAYVTSTEREILAFRNRCFIPWDEATVVEIRGRPLSPKTRASKKRNR